MKRPRLENIYFKKQDNHSLRAYKKQKSYCSRLYKQERNFFFNNLNPKFVSDIKLFWKTVKPLFTSKSSYNTNIKLTHKDEIIQNDEKDIKQLFRKCCFQLKLNKNSFVINNEHKNIQDPIQKIIVKYQLHPSILIIKTEIENTNTFRFKHIMLSDIKNEIKGLNSNKATTHNNIRPKILRQSAEDTANNLQLLFNNVISISEFPENLKLADVTPVFKKKDPLEKTNYRHASVFPPVSKIFERLMQKQINEHIKKIISLFMWIQKGFQYALCFIVSHRTLEKNH